MEETTQEKSISLQDIDVKTKIRTLWLSGKEIKEIQEELEISSGTWDNYYYLNKYGFRDFILDVKKQRMLQIAEKFSERLMKMPADSAKIASIQQKEAEFLRETQGKDLGYSKRIETIGLNINKTEPLDDKQREKLDKILKASGNKGLKETEVVENGSTEPSKEA